LKRRLKKLEQGYKVRIRNHLIAQYFPEMDAYFDYSEGSAIVKCLDPAKLGNLPFEAFATMASRRNARSAPGETTRGDPCESGSLYRMLRPPFRGLRSCNPS
jgi:hypothetical protein